MTDTVVKGDRNATIEAKLHSAGFALGDSNFYSLTLGSDGCIYYTLSSHDRDCHGRFYRYDPQTDDVQLIGDLGEIVGESGRKSIPQGKSHTPFFEMDGKMYQATQYGFFAGVDGKEQPAAVPEGYTQYPGGHFVEIDMATLECRDLAIAPPAEGILTAGLCTKNRRLYGLTWPRGIFIYHELDGDRLRDLGPCCRGGEVGEGDQYLCLCRAFAVVPDTGIVYFTRATGDIVRYDPSTNALTTIEENLKRDILGEWDPHKGGHQGYNWRGIRWHDRDRVFYGVHPRSGFLFKFDPAKEKLDLIRRICADAVLRSGRYEPFYYGYLALDYGPDMADTIYYLTGTYGVPGHDNKKLNEATHLITYNLRTDQLDDHGVIRLEDGRYARTSQTIAVHPNGRIYTCPWIENLDKGKGTDAGLVDLISFANPLA
ncbi:MAG: hypothetical protein HN742_28665 [Lentisphaerae bacterium]|jgi:hypothetical protein|nr:hypothetical protein [Lentisphaerota bacterium]MBT4817834.1 hypothetical protein [Lentisphaerota bacterium]MBT5612237.1 hypothetical protein [Lentisphaerota bacterium]MBT7845880.1 hypothetical protein [Lentisphaerota bacterium]